jgi:hypothetical protein
MNVGGSNISLFCWLPDMVVTCGDMIPYFYCIGSTELMFNI